LSLACFSAVYALKKQQIQRLQMFVYEASFDCTIAVVANTSKQFAKG
jgi:hypothetical protein